jgi:hypothetical protein
MVDASQIREHAEVVGSDGQHVGTVDKVEGGRIKLTKNDPAAQGQHHYLHLDMVASVEGGKVRLTRTAAQARDEWGSEAAGAEPGSSKAGP